MVDIRYVRRTAQAKKGQFFSAQHFFFGTWFFFQKFFFQTIIHPQQSSIIILSLNIILQTHIFKVSTARLFRLGSVNARVGLIFFSDKCYFFVFVFAVEVACWFKKKITNEHICIYFFLFWFFWNWENLNSEPCEYLGLSKGKKIIRQKKKILNFSLLSNGIKTFNQMIFFYMLDVLKGSM